MRERHGITTTTATATPEPIQSVPFSMAGVMMGHKCLFELHFSDNEKRLVEHFKIDIAKICVQSIVAELKMRYDIVEATRFHDEKERIIKLSKENECLRNRLDMKSSPIIHLGGRRDSSWRNAQEGEGLETEQQVHKPVINLLHHR